MFILEILGLFESFSAGFEGVVIIFWMRKKSTKGRSREGMGCLGCTGVVAFPKGRLSLLVEDLRAFGAVLYSSDNYV